MADDDPNPGWPLGPFRDWLRHHAGLLLDDRLRGKVDASDVVQEVLLKAYLGQSQMHGQTEGERKAWLRMVLANTLADLVRRFLRGGKRNVGREQSLEEAVQESSADLGRWLADGGASPGEQAVAGEQLLWLAEGLAALPEDQRQAVRLRHLHGRSVGAIAREMGRTPAAVAGLLRRGLEALRRRAGGE
jgi:RNA polymerase sigma-70 factor (ECF subfamily)